MIKSKPNVPQSLHSYHEFQIPKLVGSLFREGAPDTEVSSIYAVTSIQKGDGASTISLLVAREVARHPGRRVLLTSTGDLAHLTSEDLAHPDLCWSEVEQSGLLRISTANRKRIENSSWDTDPRFVRAVVELLRTHFDAVLLDTGDLLTSHDVPRLAHLIDGVVLVVQAGRTTKPQIEHALQVLTLAGGKLKGFVLNRRTYPIPERIYRWLRS